jgi:predicted ribosomally synthesized peptide with SipW-like signal peptide
MQRILLGLGTIAVLGGLVAGGSGAFFNDTETSTGNTFTAGDIDLKIDNESYAIDFNIPSWPTATSGVLVANPANSWSMADLVAGTQKFFNFTDVKPGDYGEDTISIHVGSNNAWMCAAARLTRDADESCTEPEVADDGSCVAPNTNGELDSALQFAFWVDDGDNVYEPAEGNSGTPEAIFLSGSLADMNAAGQIALADSQGSIMPTNGPIPGDSTFYIGKIWCAGTLTPTNLTQDGLDTGSPLTLGTGFTCNGALVNNAAQTDSAVGDMQFYAVQSRNNPDFTCAEDYTPVWPNLAQ